MTARKPDVPWVADALGEIMEALRQIDADRADVLAQKIVKDDPIGAAQGLVLLSRTLVEAERENARSFDRRITKRRSREEELRRRLELIVRYYHDALNAGADKYKARCYAGDMLGLTEGQISTRLVQARQFGLLDSNRRSAQEIGQERRAHEEAVARRQAMRDERDQCIRALADEGKTLEEIGAFLGVSRARAGQLTTKLGIDMSLRRAETIAAKSSAQRAQREEARRRDCAVCGKEFIRRTNERTCSAACQVAWKSARRLFDPEHYEKQRQAHARYITKYPEKAKPSEVQWAKRILKGKAPVSRRFRVRNSKTTAALLAAERSDLLPPSTPPKKELLYLCSAINKSGERCSLHVEHNGDVCHIHQGRTIRRRNR